MSLKYIYTIIRSIWEFCFIYIGENCFIYIGEKNNTCIVHVHVHVYMNIDYFKYAFNKICFKVFTQSFLLIGICIMHNIYINMQLKLTRNRILLSKTLIGDYQIVSSRVF